MNLRKNIKVIPLGNMQFYALMVELENYHRSNYDRIVFQQEIIEKFGAIIVCQWNKPRIIFSGFAERLDMIVDYDEIFITPDFVNDNLLNKDSYFNVSLQLKLPPQEHLIRFSKLIDIGFGIILPWNK